METTLQQILKVQTAILTELRLLRQALAPQAQAAPQPTAPPAQTPHQPHAAPAPSPAAVAPAVGTAPTAAAAPAPAATPTAPAAPVTAPAATAAPQAPTPPPASGSGAMLTLDELADLGGQFLEPGQKPRTRVKPVDASDLSTTILDEIKAKNKAKRDAFAAFDRFGRDR